jgi:SPP1 gp7 family putative phage head morphogenesis protein
MALGVHFGTPRENAVQSRLGDTLARHLAAADLLGRMQILRHTRMKTGKFLPLSAAAGPALRFDESGDDDLQALATAGFSVDQQDDDAERFIRQLTPVTRQVFDGLTSQYKGDAFTLAGVADQRLIQNVRDELADIARRGGTAQDFRDHVNKLTSDAGVAEVDSFTLDTAFNTAMQKAYSAGRLQQMREPHMVNAMPFWQYWTVGDFRVRPEHAVLDGFMARAIDPVWVKIYPPSGFNCRCSVVPIPEDEALKIDANAGDAGMERLPALAFELVPQRGFHTLLRSPLRF